jgi:ribulose-phosphate 3-epimerase
MQIAPSILAADFAALAEEVARVAGEADLLHVDCMDGHYVPNLSIGPPVVASLRKRTDLFLDCHLMVDNPEVLLDAFADAGADGCTIHVELGDPRPLLDRIRGLGMRAGLSLEPDTPFSAVEPFLADIDLLLVMSVRTGFGGQAFRPEALTTLAQARERVDELGLSVDLEVDGGINVTNAAEVAAAGADILVAGTAIFGAPDPAAAARAIREAAWPRQ